MDRDKQVSIRLTEDELDQIKQYAAEVGMSVSDYIRTAARDLEKITYDADIRDAIRDIHAAMREIANVIQGAQRESDCGAVVYARLAEEQLRAVNKKLRIIAEEIKGSGKDGNHKITQD